MDKKMSMTSALAQATVLALERFPEVLVIGEGAKDHKGIFGTTLPANRKFPERVFESPLSEEAVTGICGGASLMGARPIMIHQRIEFMMLAMNQLVNHISKWRYIFAGRGGGMPMVVRVIIGRGFGQSARHSQNLQSLVAHIPGLAVVAPSNAYNAKGLLLASIVSDDPVIFIEHRSLHALEQEIPTEYYEVPLGQARVAREGRDATVVTCSFMTEEALSAAEVCRQAGVEVEVVDLQTLNPLDERAILESVKKTGRLVAADLTWRNCSVAATVAALAAEKAFNHLKAPIKVVSLPDTPTPCSWVLEEEYYPTSNDILKAIVQTLGIPLSEHNALARLLKARRFDGPF